MMANDNLIANIQAKTAAFAHVLTRNPVETLEDIGQVFFCNAFAPVSEPDQQGI